MKSIFQHSPRWEKAQDVEREYWQKEHFRSSEFKEIIYKYEKIFNEIEITYSFSSRAKILDLGCGATCPSILFKNGEKYGVDPIADVFLEKDRRELANKIRLFKGSGEEIPFENNFFDVVLSRNALDHMDNIDMVMKEIKRVTKTGGVIILAIYTYTSFIACLKKITEYIPFFRNIEHPHTFTPEKFKSLCARYFQVLEEKIIFEGQNSIDYGKQDVELKEPFLHKIVAWLNRSIFSNSWFLREHLIICRRID